MFDIRLTGTPSFREIMTYYLNPAQAKWDRLTAADYAGMQSRSDLIDAVEERYSLPRAQAERDVEYWLRDIGR